jgi:apolipoprotein N-acyltransferase
LGGKAERRKVLSLSKFLLSFFIVGFGQPAWICALCPLAALFGYTLFWQSVCPQEARARKFWLATAWYACAEAVHLSWMTSIEYQGFYILGVYLFFIFCQGVQFGCLTLFIPKNFKQMSALHILAVSSMWTLFEWGRLHLMCGYSLNPVGLSLAGTAVAMQMAALWGVLGLSFWVIFVNLWGLRSRLACLGLGLLPYLLGFGHLLYQDKQAEGNLDVALVSTNLLPSEKIPLLEYLDAYIPPFEQWRKILHSLKETGKSTFDLIVLPEAAVPLGASESFYPFEYVRQILREELGEACLHHLPEASERVSNLFWGQALANIFHAEVIIGLEEQERFLKESYQAAFHFVPRLASVRRYEKRILVPLAEYLPWKFLHSLTEKYGITEFYTPGKEAKIFGSQIPFSISICYEETFSHLMREARLKGAELFINVTNDNWYPHSRLPKQHFDHARLRSVENGIALLRACNMGITGAIDSLGRVITAKMSAGEVLSVRLPLRSHKTLYSLWGDGAIVALSVFFLLLYALMRAKNGNFSKIFNSCSREDI